MVIASLASSLPPVSAVSPLARVVRRANSRKNSQNSGAGAEGDERPLAAMKTAAEASSSATQEALTKLELGG